MNKRTTKIILISFALSSLVVPNVIMAVGHPWPMFQHDARHTGQSPYIGPAISENPQLKIFIGQANKNDYFCPVRIDSFNTLYFQAKIKGITGLYAFHSDGNQKWFYPMEARCNPLAIGPNGTLYILINSERKVIAINAVGNLKWEKSFIDAIPRSNLTIGNNGTIYFLADVVGKTRLIALNGITGETIWVYETEGNLGGREHSPSVGPDGTIYFGLEDNLFAINPDGTEKWKRNFPTFSTAGFNYPWQQESKSLVLTPSIGNDGTIYIIAAGEKYDTFDWEWYDCIHAIDPQNPLIEKWEKICAHYASSLLVIGPDGTLYKTGLFWGRYAWFPSEYLTAIDYFSGQIKWIKTLSYSYSGIPPIVDAEGNIYVVNGDSQVISFDRKGNQKWSFPLVRWRSELSLGKDGSLYIPGHDFLYVISPPVPPKWSFAIISDLHIGRGYPSIIWPDYNGVGWNDNSEGEEYEITERLRNTIGLINSNKDKYNIAFVVVLGDFTDSAELSELNKAKEILDELEIPWIPLIGNHDVWPHYGVNPDLIDREAEMAPEVGVNNTGPDKFFSDIFNPQYEKLANILQNWEKSDIPIWNPETEPAHYSYFQNFAFDYNNYHFIGLDFNNRDNEQWPLKGAAAKGNLHDFSGGTWNWLKNHLQQYLTNYPESQENIIFLAHHPFRKVYWKEIFGKGFFNIGFSDKELDIINNFLMNYKNEIYGMFAGHSHNTRDYFWPEETMQIIETAANVKNSLARIVQIYPDVGIDYSKMLGYGITISAHSPVDLIIIDPDNLIINKELNQIPGANYIEEDIDEDGLLDDLISIPERKLGNYQIKVIPDSGATSTSTYTLEVSTLEDSFGYVPIVLAENISISKIPTEPYIFKSKEKISTQLIYDGDTNGQYSDLVSLSVTLMDGNNNPLSGKNIIFQIGEQSISAMTNESGRATTSLTLNQVPGKYYFIETSFNGDEDYLPSFNSKPFEIIKENIVINVSDKESFTFDRITLETEIKDDDNDLLHQEKGSGYFLEFRIATTTIGTSTIDEYGKAKIDWNVNFIPKELLETYLIIVRFAGNQYYNPAQGQGQFILKSAKWLKEDAISELESAKTGDERIDKKIDKIIWLINKSLDKDLWLDASRLVFFTGIPEWKFEDFDDFEEFEKANNLKSGIIVFHYEKVAVRLMMPKPRFKEFEIPEWFENKDELKEIKDWKIPDKLKPVFERVIAKLIKTDILLAKVSIFDAKNTLIKNPRFQKIVKHQIELAEKELEKAYLEIEKGRPDKAIMRLSHSWFHSQLAIKFANLEKS